MTNLFVEELFQLLENNGYIGTRKSIKPSYGTRRAKCLEGEYVKEPFRILEKDRSIRLEVKKEKVWWVHILINGNDVTYSSKFNERDLNYIIKRLCLIVNKDNH